MFTLETAATAAYVIAALLFILALAGLSKHETSRAGNTFGMAGMVVALVATIALALARHIEPLGLGLLIAAMAIGAAIGLSEGGAIVLATLAASASYIAAPAAVQLALPQANPGYYLTCSLVITFPFNLIVGLPLYSAMASALYG